MASGALGKSSSDADGISNLEKTDVEISLTAFSGGSNLVEILDSNFAENGTSREGFSLVNATAFIMDVTGCASGYSSLNITSAAATDTITLYKTDQNCVATLKQFSYNGHNYTGTLTGVSGTTSVFTNTADSTDVMKVRVHTQLPSPLVDGSTALFIFQQIKKGSDTNIASYTHSETLETQGVDSPNVSISAVSLSSIAADGKATFDLTLLCATTMVMSGANYACPSSGGDNENLIDTQVKLITDTYGSTLTYAQAQTEMSTSPMSVTNGAKVAGQDKFIVTLTGTGPLYTNKNMLLIIGYVDPSSPSKGTSYIYFNVDIGDP